MNPIGYSKQKAKAALEKFDIDLLVAATPVNVFYTTGLPTLHVAPNPILYVLYNQFPSLSCSLLPTPYYIPASAAVTFQHD